MRMVVEGGVVGAVGAVVVVVESWEEEGEEGEGSMGLAVFVAILMAGLKVVMEVVGWGEERGLGLCLRVCHFGPRLCPAYGCGLSA